MKKLSLSYGSKFGLVLVSFLFFLFFSLGYAQTTPKGDTTKAVAPAKLKYMGALSCKMCHNLEKTTGKQYDIWAASKHATAYTELASDKSKEVAKAKGIEDPQKSDKCLKCHITGFGASAAEKGDLGLTVQRVTPQVAESLGLEKAEGLVVTGVEPGSAGDEAGLRRGDVILEVDRKPVKTVAEYRKVVGEASKRGKGILFLVRRGESTLFLALKPQP